MEIMGGTFQSQSNTVQIFRAIFNTLPSKSWVKETASVQPPQVLSSAWLLVVFQGVFFANQGLGSLPIFLGPLQIFAQKDIFPKHLELVWNLFGFYLESGSPRHIGFWNLSFS
jgi:hypothetical protein